MEANNQAEDNAAKFNTTNHKSQYETVSTPNQIMNNSVICALNSKFI